MEHAGRFADYRERILKQTNTWAEIRRNFPSWWSTLADTLGILAVISSLFLAPAPNAQVLIAQLIVAVIAVLALSGAVITYRRSRESAAYAYAIRFLHFAIHVLRDELASKPAWSDERIKACLEEVLGAFATVFAIVKNVPFRACIKVIDMVPPAGTTKTEIADDQRIRHSYARTLCRDFITAREIGLGDEHNIEARIQDNTAFSYLFKDVSKRYFLGNDLPEMMKHGRYENSSIRKYGAGSETEWPLPYRSTMVWPIRFVTKQKSQKASAIHHFTGEQQIFGYLAVDTFAAGVFNPDLDFDLGALVADAIYMFLDEVYPQSDTLGPHQTSSTTANPVMPNQILLPSPKP